MAIGGDYVVHIVEMLVNGWRGSVSVVFFSTQYRGFS